jgi:hypothetical protein
MNGSFVVERSLFLIVDQGRLSTLLGHTPDEDNRPLRRDCGHSSDACQLALSAMSGPQGLSRERPQQTVRSRSPSFAELALSTRSRHWDFSKADNESR